MDNENPVFRSLEIIENHISEKLTVENIARGVYFSKHHYQRLFREIVGDSVMEYVTKRKLTLAGKALLETDAAIVDIALEYGYDSREGFTRSFKAYMGVTPTEYRKYGLAVISQKTVKERLTMTYSKTTDEIIRELNDFIAKSRELAMCARKNAIREYEPFWNSVADNTDTMADRIKAVLDRISTIAEDPDEITDRLAILKIIDDTMFETNVFALHVSLSAISRAKPEHISIHKTLCDKYLELAQSSELKTMKIIGFFNELSSLIIEDMRKTLEQKMRDTVQKGMLVTESIVGHGLYVKDEILRIVNELSSTPVESVTVKMLNDCLFNMRFISMAAKVEMFRWPDAKAMFEGIDAFMESLGEAADFCRTIIKPGNDLPIERKLVMILEDIAFHANILLFYTKGEIENVSGTLCDEQKEALTLIKGKVESCKAVAQSAADGSAFGADCSAFGEIADRLHEVVSDLNAEADKLGVNGGALRILAGKLNILADKVTQSVKDCESLAR